MKIARPRRNPILPASAANKLQSKNTQNMNAEITTTKVQSSPPAFLGLEKMSHRVRLWPLALLLTLLGVGGLALAASALKGKASLSGAAVLTPVSTNQVGLELNLTGIVTHLGKSAVRIHSLADVTGSTPNPIPPSTGTITSANGDDVTFTLTWNVSEVSPGVFAVAGAIHINGGTGRFTGATGRGDYHGVLDANTGACTFDGTYELLR